jgi:hypothetical protein
MAMAMARVATDQNKGCGGPDILEDGIMNGSRLAEGNDREGIHLPFSKEGSNLEVRFIK